MLRHTVTWKMNGPTKEERDRQAREIADALRPLQELVPTVKSLRVFHNELNDDKNWDLMLVADFADAAALEAYDRHPEHQAVLSVVRERVAGRAGMDFFVEAEGEGGAETA